MIHAVYKEVEDLTCERQCLGGEYHFMNTNQCNEVEDMMPQPPIIDTGGYDEILADPPSLV